MAPSYQDPLVTYIGLLPFTTVYWSLTTRVPGPGLEITKMSNTWAWPPAANDLVEETYIEISRYKTTSPRQFFAEEGTFTSHLGREGTTGRWCLSWCWKDDEEFIKSRRRKRKSPAWRLIFLATLQRIKSKVVHIQSGLHPSSHIKSANLQGSRCLSRERSLAPGGDALRSSRAIAAPSKQWHPLCLRPWRCFQGLSSGSGLGIRDTRVKGSLFWGPLSGHGGEWGSSNSQHKYVLFLCQGLLRCCSYTTFHNGERARARVGHLVISGFEEDTSAAAHGGSSSYPKGRGPTEADSPLRKKHSLAEIHAALKEIQIFREWCQNEQLNYFKFCQNHHNR